MEEKIADYLLDLSKLIFAGVVLGTVLQIENLSELTALLTGMHASVFTAIAGFLIAGKKKQ